MMSNQESIPQPTNKTLPVFILTSSFKQILQKLALPLWAINLQISFLNIFSFNSAFLHPFTSLSVIRYCLYCINRPSNWQTFFYPIIHSIIFVSFSLVIFSFLALVAATDLVQNVQFFLLNLPLERQHARLNDFLFHWRYLHLFLPFNHVSVVLFNLFQLFFFLLQSLLKLKHCLCCEFKDVRLRDSTLGKMFKKEFVSVEEAVWNEGWWGFSEFAFLLLDFLKFLFDFLLFLLALKFLETPGLFFGGFFVGLAHG